MAGSATTWAEWPETGNSRGVGPGRARVIAVGPGRSVRTLAQAARVAEDRDTLEVDAGDYQGDVAVWVQDRLIIRAVGGRVRLLADGKSAEGKGIWVVRGGDIQVEGIDFCGARVQSRNGAGIRFERGRLALRDCGFFDNENGILTASDAAAELSIFNSEFARNGFGDGFSHNLYVNAIRRLTIVASYFHHARIGHLVKSRAAENHMLYNRLSDEDGTASYELEFPNGGFARVVGNVIQQGAHSDNPVLVSFGAEGYKGRQNRLHLAHNTLVDDMTAGGMFVRIMPGDRLLHASNNLLVGTSRLEGNVDDAILNNLFAGPAELGNPGDYDYRLKAESAGRFGAVALQFPTGVDLAMREQYVHPRRTRTLAAPARYVGALQATFPYS